MAVLIQRALELDRRQSTSVLGFALLFSLTLHALAAGLLSPYWLRPAAEPSPPPLTVVLQSMPEQVTAAVTPPPAAHVPVRREPPPALPVQPVQHVSTPSPLMIDHVEPAPLAPAPVAATAPAPLTVASASASTSSGRAQTGVPAHTDVMYLIKPQPAYPAIARRMGIEGLVLLRVEVSATGLPEQVSIAQSSGTNSLDDEALRSVRASRFEPARRGDTPVAHVVEVPIRFRLKN